MFFNRVNFGKCEVNSVEETSAGDDYKQTLHEGEQPKDNMIAPATPKEEFEPDEARMKN